MDPDQHHTGIESILVSRSKHMNIFEIGGWEE